MVTDSVYLLNLKGTNYFKIGVSVNVQRRMSDLQTAMPMEVVLVAHTITPYAKDLELALHTKLSGFRVRGEWFDLPSDEALRVFQEYSAMALVDEAMGDRPSHARVIGRSRIRRLTPGKSVPVQYENELCRQIVRTLREQPNANRAQLARDLGIGRTKLYALIKEAQEKGEL